MPRSSVLAPGVFCPGAPPPTCTTGFYVPVARRLMSGNLPATGETTMTHHFEEHAHEKLVHSHAHLHVTHNRNSMTGGFDHLYSEHEHEHDHPALAHSHIPHQDFDSEHHSEAHVHDHGEPVKTERATKKSAKKAARKTTKKASR
ncbi:MAG TPA: hypothetical protein VHF25_03920 [Nitriliruptorales bacterium]|nr:hypothetical protein [Nitriliruptorales bacterium]